MPFVLASSPTLLPAPAMEEADSTRLAGAEPAHCQRQGPAGKTLPRGPAMKACVRGHVCRGPHSVCRGLQVGSPQLASPRLCPCPAPCCSFVQVISFETEKGIADPRAASCASPRHPAWLLGAAGPWCLELAEHPLAVGGCYLLPGPDTRGCGGQGFASGFHS